jgi:biopolymer transport protein ExbD
MDEIFPVSPTKKARIEIIPLIDVIFFLLATFVLFTLSLDQIRVIETQLPVPGDPRPGDNVLFIQASDAGMFYWKEGAQATPESVSAAEIPGRLAAYKRNTPEPRVFVRGDGRSTFGPAVFLLDEVRKVEIKQVSIETKESPTGR